MAELKRLHSPAVSVKPQTKWFLFDSIGKCFKCKFVNTRLDDWTVVLNFTQKLHSAIRGNIMNPSLERSLLPDARGCRERELGSGSSNYRNGGREHRSPVWYQWPLSINVHSSCERPRGGSIAAHPPQWELLPLLQGRELLVASWGSVWNIKWTSCSFIAESMGVFL